MCVLRPFAMTNILVIIIRLSLCLDYLFCSQNSLMGVLLDTSTIIYLKLYGYTYFSDRFPKLFDLARVAHWREVADVLHCHETAPGDSRLAS